MTPAKERQEGIIKGSYLVDQYASMKLATLLYESGKYQAAANVAHAFSQKPIPIIDKQLNEERILASNLAKQLREDCKKRGISIGDNYATRSDRKLDIQGEWIESNSGLLDENREVLKITSEQTAELYETSEQNPLRFVDDSEVAVNRRYIVFKDWGRTFRYRLSKDNLELRDGEQTTTYTRKAGIAQIEQSNLMNQLQRAVSGLPEDPAESFLSGIE